MDINGSFRPQILAFVLPVPDQIIGAAFLVQKQRGVDRRGKNRRFDDNGMPDHAVFVLREGRADFIGFLGGVGDKPEIALAVLAGLRLEHDGGDTETKAKNLAVHDGLFIRREATDFNAVLFAVFHNALLVVG